MDVHKSLFYHTNTPLCTPTNNSLSKDQKCLNSLFKSESCYECPEDHFVDVKNQVCQQNPNEGVIVASSIQNCFFLINQNICKICNEGYYKNFSKKFCYKHTKIVDNCKIMSQ